MTRGRLFVALMLGPELGAALATEVSVALGAERRRFRLPRPEGLHLTLAFLGEVSNEELDRLAPALGAALEGARAPELTLGGAGSFPGRGRERVLWMGVSPMPPGRGELTDLHRRTGEALRAADLEPARSKERFRPHVTVARPRDRAGVPEAFYGLDLELPWCPRELALVESVAVHGPRHYRPLLRFPLGGAGS